MPSILFAGAAQNVTGSRHVVTIGGHQILLDCGNFQGDRNIAEAFNRALLFDAKKIEAVILSHGHLDHCGALPLLMKQGFKGVIWSTEATRDVAEAIMLDNARIAEENFRHVKKNEPNIPHLPPVYDDKDVKLVMQRFKSVRYGKKFAPAQDVKAMLYDAGHIIGSSVIRLESKGETIGFTGDLGRVNTPTLEDPTQIQDVHTLVMEATYGGREHRGFDYARERLAVVMKDAFKMKSKIIAPSFALGRTQLLLAMIFDLIASKKVPSMPIIVDSPLADKMSVIYEKHKDLFDAETRALIGHARNNPFHFKELQLISDRDESKMLNGKSGPMLIISSSGMAESGRVKHHLAHNIHDPHTIVLITGYMASGTLGRHIIEGKRHVKIFGKWFPMNARVEDLRGLSAHADEKDLVAYANNIKGLRRIFLVHGEPQAGDPLTADLLKAMPGVKVKMPTLGETVEW
ncbi:MAG: MBL fold metallo-hydrolase [bacterium]